MDPLVVRQLQPRAFHQRFLDSDLHPDGRALNQPRKRKIATRLFTTADGSSSAKIGNTHFVCGVRAEVGPKMVEKEQRITIKTELSPVCGEAFREHRKAQLLANRLSESISEIVNSGVVFEPSQLKISEDAAWVLIVDLQCLEYDGNGFDAGLLAVITALTDTQLPALLLKGERYVVTSGAVTPITLLQRPTSITFGVVGEKVLVDPSLVDEEIGSTVSLCKIGSEWMTFRMPGPHLEPKLFHDMLYPMADAVIKNIQIEA